MSIEVMKQALEALALFASDESDEGQVAITAHEALRQAIEQAEKQDADEWYEKALWGDKQEPVMWMDAHDFKRLYNEGTIDCDIKLHKELGEIPLYTAPPQREWVGLTVEDKDTIWYMVSCGLDYIPVSRADDLFYAIEAKLKEKNK